MSGQERRAGGRGTGAGWRRILIGGLLVLLVVPGGRPARAHVTDADMPDSVAEMEYQILLDFQPEKTAVRNKLAMVFFRKKRYQEAEAEFRKVLAQEPNNDNALDGLGLVMSQTDRLKEAVAEFQAAIQANPKDVMVHYHLGQAYDRLGDPSAAEAAYRQALKLAEQPDLKPPLKPAELESIRQALAADSKQAPAAVPPKQ